MNNNVDIVITWVDGSDPNWLAEKKMYTKKSNNVRYRDWDNLVYIFRGIEQFMPWVHKIYFVTWGHLPKWLNIDNEKLVIVNHQDYIPEKYLPTFNSNVLDLNMFRIPGLSEQYINFNDDTFVIKPTKLEDFFYNGKPKDMACISPQPINRDMIMNIELNNMEIINDYFSINDIKRNKKKWLNFKMYGSYAIRTLIFMRFKTILGFFVPHIPISHLKSVVEELWEKEYAEYDKTCMHKFRTKEDINDWLSRSWQLATGNFEPRSKYFGTMCDASEIDLIKKILWKSKYKMLCINDSDKIDESSFKENKKLINGELNKLLPQKSSFEICFLQPTPAVILIGYKRRMHGLRSHPHTLFLTSPHREPARDSTNCLPSSAVFVITITGCSSAKEYNSSCEPHSISSFKQLF